MTLSIVTMSKICKSNILQADRRWDN